MLYSDDILEVGVSQEVDSDTQLFLMQYTGQYWFSVPLNKCANTSIFGPELDFRLIDFYIVVWATYFLIYCTF